MTDKMWFLKRYDLFSQLAPEELERLEHRALMRSFRRKDIIYFPAEHGQSLMVLTSGRVKLKDITPDGKESILAFIEEGEIFGELSLFDEEPRNEYAEAVEACQVLAIPREDMLWVLEQRPTVALAITKLIGLRRRRLENRLRNILFRSNRERLIHLLLELKETHGRQAGHVWEIMIRLSHQELASLIGTTRESVTITLGHLQSEGLIRIHRRRITILDHEQLFLETNRSFSSANAH